MTASVPSKRSQDDHRSTAVAETVAGEHALDHSAELRDQDLGDARKLLGIYLSDHLAGSSGGLALAGRCRRSNEASELGDYLHSLERELLQEREQLKAIAASSDVRLARWKTVIGRAAADIGRLKRNGRLRGYSPLSRVVELEGLIAGVTTKRQMWRAVKTIAVGEPMLDATELDRLTTQADGQLERLRFHHREAVIAAFGHGHSAYGH